MNAAETIISNARFLAQTKQIEYADYERFKAALAKLPLTERDYADALKKLCEVIGL